MKKLSVFLSSAMTGELNSERFGIRIFFKSNPALIELFELYTIEEHASPQGIQNAFVDEVRRSDILILLLDKKLREAVKKEFEEAINSNTKIFIYIRNTDARDHELTEFIGQHAYKYHCGSFHEPCDLCEKIKNDIVSDLTKNYYNPVLSKNNEEYIIVPHARDDVVNNLRYYEFDVIKQLSECENFKNLDADQLISLATLQVDETGNLKNSLLIYEIVLYRDPYNWLAYNNRGLLLFEMGRLVDAYFSYCKALELNKNSDATLYNLGLYYARVGIEDRAIDFFEKSLTLNPDKESALEHLLNIYIQNKDYETALMYAKKAHNINQTVHSIYNLCISMSLVGDHEGALLKSECLSGSKYYEYARSMIMYSSADWERCICEIDRHLDIHGFDYGLVIKKINCFINLNKIEEACFLFDNTEKNNYIYPHDYNNIGYRLYEKKVKLDYASKLIIKAVELDPSILQAWKNIQCIFGEIGNVDQGIIISDLALKYFPDDTDLILNKTRFMIFSGEIKGAISFALKEISRILRNEISQDEIEAHINQIFKESNIENIEKVIDIIRKIAKPKI